MNLINFVNLESASQPIEGLGVEGKAGGFPMEAGLTGNTEGKAFGATFNEQLRRDGLKHGLQKREPALAKEGTPTNEGKAAEEGAPDMTGGKPASNGDRLMSRNPNTTSQDTVETGEGRIPGRLMDWNPDTQAAQLSGEMVEALVPEEVTTGENPEVADVLESRAIPSDSDTEEEPDGKKAPEGKGNGPQNGVPSIPVDTGEPVPAEDWVPGEETDPDSTKGRQNPNGEQRPVTWTREHVSGEKLLPERTERPQVPPQAQARFTRGTPVASTGENSTQATVDSGVSATELPEATTSGSSETMKPSQVTAQAVSFDKSSATDELPAMPAGKSSPKGERPEVPPQAQARFVREGEAPERPDVPQQARARFVRETEQTGNSNLARNASGAAPKVANASSAAEVSDPVVLSASKAETAIQDGSERILDEGRELPARNIRTRPSAAREPSERAERPSANVKVQGQDKLEIAQNTERIAEIRTRIPEKAAAPARSQLFQSQTQTAAQSQVSANTASQANVPVEAEDTVIPEAVSNPPTGRRRESPRDRYNRLAETKSVSSESSGLQEKETAGTQRNLVDPTRRAASFMVGNDKDSDQRERSKHLGKSEDQSSRAEKSANINGRAQGTFSRPQTVQLSSVNDAFLKIMSTVERVTQNAITSRVQLNIDLENGDKMKVMLKVARGHVQTVFMTDSDGLRGAMKEGWEQFQRQLSDKGFAYSEPEFRGSGQDRENSRQQAEQSWNDVLDDAGFSRPGGIQSAAVETESGSAASPVSTAAKHALDAYA